MPDPNTAELYIKEQNSAIEVLIHVLWINENIKFIEDIFTQYEYLSENIINKDWGALCTGGQWSVFTVRAGSGEHRAGDREQES